MKSKKIFLSLLLIASTIAFSACNKSTAETKATELVTEATTVSTTESVTEATTALATEYVTEPVTASKAENVAEATTNSTAKPATEATTASNSGNTTKTETASPEEATAVATEMPSSVARMQQVDKTLSELCQYDEFKKADDDKKAELAMNLLNELVYEELIEKDSISYNQEQRLISFKYIDGATGDLAIYEFDN